MVPGRPDSSSTRKLARCQRCPSALVHPLRAQRLNDSRWRVKLRCPDCERVAYETATMDEMKAFDRSLSDARALLLAHLGEIERIARETEIALFCEALAADAILPEDFAPTRD